MQGGDNYDDNWIAARQAEEAYQKLKHEKQVEHERKLSISPELIENPRLFSQLEANVVALAHQLCYSKWSYVSGDKTISVDAEAFRALIKAVNAWNDERVK